MDFPIAFSEDKITIAPLGGCGEFGMNLTIYAYQNKFIVVDCGVLFPESDLLGVNQIIPNATPWFEAFGGKPTAFIITHGHEDHVGAIAHMFKRWPAPIYATAWTACIARDKMTQLGVDVGNNLHVVNPKDVLALGKFSVEWIHMNHSIPMTASIAIRVAGKSFLHTSDFKLEEAPLFEERYNEAQLKDIGDRGIDILLCDSTNAPQDGFSLSEAHVLEELQKVVRSQQGCVFVTTFASHLWRIKSLIQVAGSTKRRVVVLGASMEKTLAWANDLGLLDDMEKKILINKDDAPDILPEHLLVLVSGCQGEHRSTLARLVRNEHKLMSMGPGDTLIFSSRIIPGNEKVIAGLLSECIRQDVHVITTRQNPKIHTSGHAQKEEIKKLLRLIRPKQFIPLHGTFVQTIANLRLAREAGVNLVHSVASGDAMEVDPTSGECRSLGSAPIERLYVDENSNQSHSWGTLKERLRIGQQGLAVLNGAFHVRNKKWIAAPRLHCAGFRLMDELQEFEDSVLDGGNPHAIRKENIEQEIATNMQGILKDNQGIDELSLNDELSLALRRLIYQQIGKKVIAMSVVRLVDRGV